MAEGRKKEKGEKTLEALDAVHNYGRAMLKLKKLEEAESALKEAI